MKTIYTISVFLFSCNFLFSQGEIIDRESKKVNDYNLKIVAVDSDSLSYNSFGKIHKIPLSSIIAFRVGNNSDFIFLDPKDKETYWIKNNMALTKEEIKYARSLKKKNKYDYIFELISNYELPNETFESPSIQHKITLLKSDSSKLVKANPPKKLYIILKGDSLNNKLRGKIFKITNDSILYLAIETNEGTSFFGVKKCDIKYIGIESLEEHKTRMILATFIVVIGAVLPIPCLPMAIYMYSRPKFKLYDIEKKWNLILLDKNIQLKRNSKL